MNSDKEELVFLANAIRETRRRRLNMQLVLRNVVARRRQVFECCFASTFASLPTKQQHSSSTNSFLSSVEQKYWLVGQVMEYLFRSKVQENLPSMPVDLQFHFEPY